MLGARMARFAVVGKPVAHSLSPVMQRAAFRALHIHATYEAIEAGPQEAPEVFARLRDAGYAGWNVTTPLKETALSLVDRTSEEAQASRAINTVRRSADASLSGHNTDGNGLIAALRELWSFQPRDASVLVLGTGPAARAVMIALLAHGADIACWSRDAQRAVRLAPPPSRTPALVVSALPSDAVLPPYIIQATDDETMIFDLNYGRDRSPVAHMLGRRRSNGIPLLLHQGVLSFEWWTGRPAPIDVMREALESHAGRHSV